VLTVQTVLSSRNMSASAASDDVHAMSSLDLSDVMYDFSQMNVGSVVVACLLMVCTLHSRTFTSIFRFFCYQTFTDVFTARSFFQRPVWKRLDNHNIIVFIGQTLCPAIFFVKNERWYELSTVGSAKLTIIVSRGIVMLFCLQFL